MASIKVANREPKTIRNGNGYTRLLNQMSIKQSRKKFLFPFSRFMQYFLGPWAIQIHSTSSTLKRQNIQCKTEYVNLCIQMVIPWISMKSVLYIFYNLNIVFSKSFHNFPYADSKYIGQVNWFGWLCVKMLMFSINQLLWKCWKLNRISDRILKPMQSVFIILMMLPSVIFVAASIDPVYSLYWFHLFVIKYKHLCVFMGSCS